MGGTGSDAMDAVFLNSDLLRNIVERLGDANIVHERLGDADAFVFALVCHAFRDAVCAPLSLKQRFQDSRRTVLALVAVRSVVWLQWARDMHYTWDAQTCSEAVAGNHIEVLKYAKMNLWNDWFKKHYLPDAFAAHAPDLSLDDLFELLGIDEAHWGQLIRNLEDGGYVTQLPKLLTNSGKNLVTRMDAYARAQKWALGNTYDPTTQRGLRNPSRNASTMAFQTALQQLRESAGLRAVIQLVLALAARKARHTIVGTDEAWDECGPDAGAGAPKPPFVFAGVAR